MKRVRVKDRLGSCQKLSLRGVPAAWRMSCAVLCLSCIAVRGEGLGSWTQFGGNDGSFSVTVSGALESWPGEGPLELWSRSLGAGNSGIVVDGGQLFAMYRPYTLEGLPSVDEWVIALDASNGETHWSYSYPSATLDGQEEYGGGNGPHATPTLDFKRLFTLGYSGMVSCIERKTGKLLWNLDLVQSMGAEPVQFGFSASPILFDGRLIIQAAGPDSGLVALDPATGSVIWKSPAAKFSYASPVPFEIEGEDQLIFLTGDTVDGIAADSGRLRWRFNLRKPGLTNVPTPMYLGGGRILIAGQGVGGSQLIQVLPDKKGAFRVEALWRSSRMGLFHSNWLRLNEGVYGGESFFFGMDWERGRRAWNERGFPDSNLVGVGGDRAIILSKAGVMALAELSLKGAKVISKFPLFLGEAWTPPTIVGTHLFARDREMLVAFDLSRRGGSQEASSFRRMSQEFSERMQSSRVSAALESVERYLQATNQPLEESFLLRQATLLRGEQRFGEAIEVLQFHLANVTQSASVYGMIGQMNLAAGDQNAALEAFRKAQAKDSGSADYRLMVQQLSGTASEGVLFRLPGFDDAGIVNVAGEFNGWDPNRTPLIRRGDAWEIRVPLSAGRYQYKFVVDGKWMLDPINGAKQDDGNGNQNSLLFVE